MGCKFYIEMIDFYDFDNNPVTKKMYCTNEKNHSGNGHLIIALDEDGKYNDD